MMSLASLIGQGREGGKYDENKITGDGPDGQFDPGAKGSGSTRENLFVLNERRKRYV